jgi:FkbM family methyltransferase
MSTAKSMLRGFLQRRGIVVHRYVPHHSPALRRARILAANHITCVLDVGASVGEYARELRSIGYTGRIVSFEPQRRAFEELAAAAAADPAWECRRLALGSRYGEAELRVARNSVSSSFLPVTERHLEMVPDARQTTTEMVQEVPLDSVIDAVGDPADCLMLKVDVQGYELNVLAGAPTVVARARVIELEVSLDELYEDGATLRQLVDLLDDAAFRLASFEPARTDVQTGYVSWADAIFVRRDAGHSAPAVRGDTRTAPRTSPAGGSNIR